VRKRDARLSHDHFGPNRSILFYHPSSSKSAFAESGAAARISVHAKKQMRLENALRKEESEMI